MPAIRLVPLATAIVWAAACNPAFSQSGGDPVPEVGQDVERGEAPVIIDQAPSTGNEDAETIRPAHEDFVQIQGAWATDEAACGTTEESGGGLYLTDTLIRWEGATCSIRDVDAEEGRATVYAQCTGEEGRSTRTFELEVSGEDALTLRLPAGEQPEEVTLTRCPDQ